LGIQKQKYIQMRKNINRGYRKLRVWQDAGELYVLTCRIFRKFPYDLKRVTSNQIASVDSVQRNIAEGYCRKSINDYLLFLNYALGSLGESVSSMHVYRQAEQITEEEFENWDKLAYKLENGLLKLVERLQYKKISQDWDDNFMVKESNVIYELTPREE
jgi:four helix bundle protein